MIIQKENKILRKTAEKVANIKSDETKMLINRMAEAMFNEPDGIGIAAPQIGESLQIFLVARDLLSPPSSPPYQGGESSRREVKRKREYLTFINPVLKKISQKKEKDVEGCLSVRGLYGEISRSEKVTVEYFDETGKKYYRGASGLLARVIQHEVDHLNGVLFIDRAKNLKTISNS